VNKSLGIWKARHFVRAIFEGRSAPGTVGEIIQPRRSANKSRQLQQGIFSLTALYPSVGNVELANA
jgi:hypothetical protein